MRTPILAPAQGASHEPTHKILTAPGEDALPVTECHTVETTPLPSALDLSFPRVRGYELIAVVGSGGMGIVYEARHKELNRRAAIKTLRGDALIDQEFRERFRAEAEAIAKLQHPNIIQVFEVGLVDQLIGETHTSPFIALEFVDGGSLSQRTRTPQSAQFAAKMVETLARAAHVAHQLGVIHRDLKPSNVLLTRDGVPKIADFGIAKQIDAGQPNTGRNLTRAGTVMGTPEYMAREQLEGEPPTPSVDVYSLGVILYELLTARVPFQGATFSDTMMLALREEPVSPRRLQPGIPRDLETICLKCMEKSPAKRYASAEALADDLAAFREGRTIKARAVGTVERTLRWSRRNPAVAILTVVLQFVAFTGLAGIIWQWNDARRNAAESKVNEVKASAAANDARNAAKKERWELYRVNLQAASSALRLYDVNAARRALDGAPEEYRDWVWSLQQAQLDRSQVILRGTGEQIAGSKYTPDGRRVLLQGQKGTLRAWDLVEQKEFLLAGPGSKMHFGELSSDGKMFAYGTDDDVVVVCVVATGETRAILRGHTDDIDYIRFSPDATRIATTGGDRTARIWDVATGKQLHLFQAPQEIARTMLVTPDFRYAIARWDGAVTPRIWDVQTGREVAKLTGHQERIYYLQFSPKGDRVVTVENFPSNVLRIWEVPTGRLLATLRGHENQIEHIDFSPDGTRLATCAMDRTVRLWDVSPSETPREVEAILVLRGHTGNVHHVTFSPDGKRLASSSHDRTVRYWDAKTGQQLAVLHGHTSFIRRASFRDDGSVIASASHDGTVRLWDMRDVERDFAIRGHTKFVYDVAFHPDNERIASAAWDGTARVWSATSGKELLRLDHGKGIFVTSVVYHPTGRTLATRSRDNSVRLWDSDTGELLHRWVILSKDWRDSRLAFHPGGNLLACGAPDWRIRIWDVNTKAEVALLTGHTDAIRDVAFSPNGRWLASSSELGDPVVRIWDVGEKQQVKVLQGHEGCVYTVAWNPTGTLLVSGSIDGTIRLWDTATWQQLEVLRPGMNIYSLTFSPDGKLLAAACADNLIRIWNVDARKEIAELSGHNDYVHHVAFSQDGTRLVSGSGDGALRVWDSLQPSQRARR